MIRYVSGSRYFVLTIITLCFVAAPVSAKSSKTIKVFLLGGQSNMAGVGKAVKLQPPYSKPFSKVKIWDTLAQTWTNLSPVFGNKKGQFGPEISFGHAIAKVFSDEDIRLIKHAVSGTALHDDWDPKTKGDQYVMFMETAKAALAELESSKVKYEISGMLWLQGESDAHENRADTYEKNLSNFIEHMRKEFKTPKMPFIIARVRNFYGGKTGQAKIVRDAQVKVADTDQNVGCFDTDNCSMANAGHYDAAGLIEIGKRFAATFQDVVDKAKK